MIRRLPNIIYFFVNIVHYDENGFSCEVCICHVGIKLEPTLTKKKKLDYFYGLLEYHGPSMTIMNITIT
jgi:hypothetical protein